MHRKKLSLITLLAFVFAPSAFGHEFWIEPEEFQLRKNATVVANFRVGETFKGGALSYLPQRSRRFVYEYSGQVRTLEPRIGERPAINLEVRDGGLLVLVHATANSKLRYSEFEKFADFVRHKAADDALTAQTAEGFPEEGIGEVYSRYAKSLVRLGEGLGEDRSFGLETEIVALENPYTGNTQDGLDVLVLYQEEPRRDAQIEVFERAPDTSVIVSLVRTDDFGRATIPVRPGHEYMLDAVVLRRPDAALAAEMDVIWESLWANLTFAIPE